MPDLGLRRFIIYFTEDGRQQSPNYKFHMWSVALVIDNPLDDDQLDICKQARSNR